MWCPDCQQQVAVRLKPGESAVRCARCGAKFTAPSQSRRFDPAAAATPAPLPFRAEVLVQDSSLKATPCPISGTASWLIDEDLRHIARTAAGVLKGADDRMHWLDALLQGRGFEASTWSAAAGVEEGAAKSAATTEQEKTSESQVADRAVVHAVTIQSPPIADQLQAARRPSKWALGLGQAASAFGGLALVNGLGLAVWARFGGRPELLPLGVLVCLTAAGLLFVSHLLQAHDAPPRKRPVA